MKVIIKEGCIGCGFCEGACPKIFSVKSDGRYQVDKQPDESEISKVKDAIELCPAQVIEFTDW